MPACVQQSVTWGRIRTDVEQILRFAVLSELVPWDDDQHAAALAMLFPERFAARKLRKSQRLDKAEVVARLQPVLEFCWTAGVLEWSAEEFAEAIAQLSEQTLDHHLIA